MHTPKLQLGSIHAGLASRMGLVRAIAVGVVVGAVLIGSVASVAAKPDKRTLTVRSHVTSYVTTQADPAVFAPGEEIYLGTILFWEANPREQIGTGDVHVVVTGAGGSSFLIVASFTLPDGKITAQSLFDLETEANAPTRKLAITGGTGAYLAAGGELTVTTISDTDEIGVFKFEH